MQLPTPLVQLLHQGKELGVATDEIFQREKSKHEEGTVGILTGGLINRDKYYEHAAILALTPFANPGLYGSNTKFDPRTFRGAAPSEYGTEDTGICTAAARHCARWAGRAASHGQSVWPRRIRYSCQQRSRVREAEVRRQPLMCTCSMEA